ncbi:MAG: enoyl-CoA hydratase/isomerase family protein [Vulcanimicrobiaceae bacterium]
MYTVRVEDLLIVRRDRVGVLTLNRPKVLNAITLPMFEQIGRSLAGWRDDPDVEAVVVCGNGRTFSAGGDITAVRRAALAGNTEENDRLYRTEYSLNALIATYPKPYLTIAHGYCMGGGLGLLVHGSHRIVAADTLIAMPETAIGFFPDVGATYVFARLAHGLGMYLGLTGARLPAATALRVGLATHSIDDASIDAVARAIVDGASIEPTLARYASHPPTSPDDDDGAIARCFDAGSIDEIVTRLEDESTPWASATRDRLRAASPTSLVLTFAMIRNARSLDLLTALRVEYILAKQMWRRPDFLEGVRAVVIDKDRNARWEPARVGDVDAAAIDLLVAEAVREASADGERIDRVDTVMFAGN